MVFVGVLLLQAWVIMVKAADPTPSNISRPGCIASCGAVSIPYPFGIGPRCYREGFDLTCNNTFQPPKLFLGSNNNINSSRRVEVIEIVLDEGQVTIQNGIDSWTSWEGLENGPYTLSSEYNQFIIIGCSTVGSLVDLQSNDYISECSTICNSNVSLLSIIGSCSSGIGCCQSSIPKRLKSFDIRVSFLNQTEQHVVDGLSNTAFVAQSLWFRNLSHIHIKESMMVPAVLDWSIGQVTWNASCEDAENSHSSACVSENSECVGWITRSGYICKCSIGYHGNPYLHHGCLEYYTCGGTCMNEEMNSFFYPNQDQKRSALLVIIVGLAIGLGLLLLLVISAALHRRWKQRKLKKRKERYFRQNRGLLLQQLLSSNGDVTERMQIFKLEELEKATNKFDDTRILGRGGHGTVYKGILSDQRVVAIKKSKINVQREIDQFINEVAVLSQVNHRNVVRLFGCCLETQVPLLVYEFISNGTLSNHLHGRNRSTSLCWEDRLRIAKETAGSLAYLHSAASISIFHRDVKSSNILLDDNLTAKVSDFGASRTIPFDQTRVTTAVQGTFGYLDPEYFHTGQLTEKSDVYSFGVILVELLTGMKPVSDARHEEEMNLVAHFIRFLTEDRLFQLVEARVVEEGTREDVEAVARLAEICLRLRGEERPTMKEVEARLEGLRRYERKHQHPWSAQYQQESEKLVLHQSPSACYAVEATRQHSLEIEFMLSSQFPR